MSSRPLSQDEYDRWYDAHAWDPVRDSGMTVETDLAPAAWIEPLLAPRSFEVRMTVPQGFEAYARIFYPFVGETVEMECKVEQELLTWSQVASRHGRVAHALMEKETIACDDAGRTAMSETFAALSPAQLRALLPILSRHTASSSAWFLLWDGWGNLNKRIFNSATPRVRHDMRDLYLLRGSLRSFEEMPDVPNYCWPDDRAWCLCGDCDFEWMYLAGSVACIEEVLAVPVLDAFATSPANPAHSGMDVVNDPEGTVPR